MTTRVKRFRDPLYDYIYVSQIEAEIIRHPLMNRLHYIHQNGTAYLTYHAAHSPRFPHSLGAMHVCGLIMSRAFRFIPDEVYTKLRQVTAIALQNGSNSLDAIESELAENAFGFIEQDGLYRIFNIPRVRDKAHIVELMLFQATRLALLMHDIGHPPYSHTLEHALHQAFPDDYKGHEIAGQKIIERIVEKFSPTHIPPKFAAGTLSLARSFALKEGEGDPLRGIANVVSSDIDADRLDYVRRDLASAGLALNSYDLGRLIDSSTICYDEEKRQFSLRYTTECLSMVEIFFQGRLHLYHWMLFHHNVIRTNMALMRAILLILRAPERELPDESYSLRQRIGKLALLEEKETVDDYESFTDAFIESNLREILRQLDQKKKGAGLTRESENELWLLLSVFLRRQTELMTSLWKRPDQYADFAKAALRSNGDYSSDEAAVREFNKRLKGQFTAFESSQYRSYVEKCQASGRSVVDMERYTKSHREENNLLFCREMEGNLRDRAKTEHGREKKVYVYYHHRFDAVPKDYRLLRPRMDGEVDLAALSPALRALSGAWEDLPHLWVFVEETVAAPVESLDQYRKLFAAAIKRYLGTR